MATTSEAPATARTTAAAHATIRSSLGDLTAVGRRKRLLVDLEQDAAGRSARLLAMPDSRA